MLFLLECFCQCHTDFERNQFRHPIGEPIRLALHPSHVTYHRLSRHRAERNDLRNTLPTISFSDVVNDLIPSLHAKVHVKIRHRHTIWIQKTLKEQVIFDGIEIRDTQYVRHQRTRTGTAPGTNRDVILFCPLDKIHHH